MLEELHPEVEKSREALQKLGTRLDRKTKGAWVEVALRKQLDVRRLPDAAVVLVDSVRMQGQIDAIRTGYGQRVIHVHLTAPVDVLAARYAERKKKKKGRLKELRSYKEVQKDPTESKVERLKKGADIVIDSKRCTEDDVVVRAAAHVGMYGREYLPLVDVLVGGQFGSEGKGQIAAYLAPEYDYIVRVGGPNAGHTVFMEPENHVFHHLPSGTTKSEAHLVLGPGAVLNVDKLLEEIGRYSVDLNRLSIDPNAMIISPGDIKAEEGIRRSIGSTKQGVGQATARKITKRNKSTKLAKDIRVLRHFIRPTFELLDRAFRDEKRILLEGTQGTGLSLHHGPYPCVTSRETTVAGCLADAGISPGRVRKVIMVCRTYPIRVAGKQSGPFAHEIEWEDIAERSGLSVEDLRGREITTTTRRDRRVGEFEWTWLRRAASLNAPTDIALTFADYLDRRNRTARRFEQLRPETIRFIEEVERVATAPVSLIATRFHSRSIIDRRSW